jgi:hypothetical protein
MNLPRELRQAILFYTYDEDTTFDQNPYIDHFLMRETILGNIIKDLRLVHLLLIKDVDYVKETWIKSHRNKAYELKKEAQDYWDNFLKYCDDDAKSVLVWKYWDNLVEFGETLLLCEWAEKHPILWRLKWRQRKKAFQRRLVRVPVVWRVFYRRYKTIIKYYEAANAVSETRYRNQNED